MEESERGIITPQFITWEKSLFSIKILTILQDMKEDNEIKAALFRNDYISHLFAMQIAF